MGETSLPQGVIMLPVSQQAQTICLGPGSELVGIRFHPAVSYALFARHYASPTLLQSGDDRFAALFQLYTRLCEEPDFDSRKTRLERWASDALSEPEPIPDALIQAFLQAEHPQGSGNQYPGQGLSQRQIERLFQRWLQMTPKRYQRIVRIRKAVQHLRQHPQAGLAETAHAFGFSDQAHMTREFQAIARVTPGRL